MSKSTKNPAKAKSRVVRPADLPLHCPTDDVALWSAHPKVYLPIDETGTETCPYCGTHYILKNE